MAAAGAAAADVVFRTPECFPLSLSGLNDSGLNVAYPFALPYLLSICQLLDLKNAKKTVARPSNFISGMFRFVLFYFFFLVLVIFDGLVFGCSWWLFVANNAFWCAFSVKTLHIPATCSWRDSYRFWFLLEFVSLLALRDSFSPYLLLRPRTFRWFPSSALNNLEPRTTRPPAEFPSMCLLMRLRCGGH